MDSLCWVMLYLIDLLFRHLRGGMCLEPAWAGDENSALGSVRVGATEIDVNRMFELLFSIMHPFQRKTKKKSTGTIQSYFHGSVTCSRPFIRKNRFICKFLNRIRVKCTTCMLACLDYSRIQGTNLLRLRRNSSVLSKSKYETCTMICLSKVALFLKKKK
jgi:hypothetical protein